VKESPTGRFDPSGDQDGVVAVLDERIGQSTL
jgi:hypothetical protein